MYQVHTISKVFVAAGSVNNILEIVYQNSTKIDHIQEKLHIEDHIELNVLLMYSSMHRSVFYDFYAPKITRIGLQTDGKWLKKSNLMLNESGLLK